MSVKTIKFLLIWILISFRLDTFAENKYEKMVQITSSHFIMGCDKGDENVFCQRKESPSHRLNIKNFWIDIHEVTVFEYALCIEKGACTLPDTISEDCSDHVGKQPNAEYNNWINKSVRKDHPINCVTWHQAKTYCEWLGKRLPTEAEWEKAARGVDGRQYPWGNEPATCNHAIMTTDEEGGGCGLDSTWPVGSKIKGASPYGVLDMSGNIAEWTADWYDENLYRTKIVDDSQGPITGKYRVVKGGRYSSPSSTIQTFSRSPYEPDRAFDSVGFRCALSEE